MVLEKIKNLVSTDTTYTYECADCHRTFESGLPRERSECPECGGPPVVPETGA